MRVTTSTVLLLLVPVTLAKINRFYAQHVLAAVDGEPTLSTHYAVVRILSYDASGES